MTTINFLTPVQDLIQQVEVRMREQSRGHHSELGAALNHLLSSGGKRVRPAVVLLTGGMLGAGPERLVTLSAAIELLHTATLVHDDLIDGSLLRRGIPTINAQWTPAATVLTGDFIFARAAELAADTNSVEVMHLFARTLATIVNGEINQLFASRGVASRENYFRRIHAKTAALFELATGAAAVLSEAREDQVDAVCRFGYEIGMAFQIVDDVFDFTGDPSKLGKPVGSDLRQGLITLPALCYLESYPGNADMMAVMNGNGYDEARIQRLVTAIRNSGAIEQALDEARRFVQRGLDALAGMTENESRQSLEELARYIVDRPL